ncbi:MAG TPA: DNA mismatch repair protein MutS [Edaphocola sp.]|nr:DNA mismatch repair protein MutS [Edaphocola sp.]
MLQLYPGNAAQRLEFDKIRQLLLDKCTTDDARQRAANLRCQSNIAWIEKALLQTKELFQTFNLGVGDYFPGTTIKNLERELKLLTLPYASLQIADLVSLRKLCHNIQTLFRWFKGKTELYPNLFALLSDTAFEPAILDLMATVIDEHNHLRDDASDHLKQIRMALSDKRRQLRQVFDANVRKLGKQGYLADIGESFLNNRRCVAVLAEQKRIVKGIIHGESDSGKTVFIEPENTVLLNNDITLLELDEQKEILQVLRALTAKLSVYHPVLQQYYRLCGIYDFIYAKALLARDMDAQMPAISPHPGTKLIQACHPLLFLKNRKEAKNIVPLNVQLDREERILVISGPNAGGKTVAMKTIGLLQLMIQAGLLIPADGRSEVGIFKQVMVHIGDTQSIENELSTYSAHLKDMNEFLRFANGKALFFIDELGSGSDPYLGGSFAEAIVEGLAQKQAYGVITTHYLNLKIMAGKTKGMQNAAMLFDEEKLLPLFQLVTGKPGSSYTFAIAQRSGLPEKVIDRARQLTDSGHLRLDKLLLEVEQQAVYNEKTAKELERQLAESRKSKAQYDLLMQKEQHRQQVETLKLQNKIKQEELQYLRDTERKFKQLVQEWKKTDNKQAVIRSAEKLLFKKKQMQQNAAAAQKADKQYKTLKRAPVIGDLVLNKTNHQAGRLEQINGQKGVVRIGKLPFTIALEEWVVALEKHPNPGK